VGGYNTKNVAGEEQHSLIQVGLLKSTAEKKVRVKKTKTCPTPTDAKRGNTLMQQNPTNMPVCAV